MGSVKKTRRARATAKARVTSKSQASSRGRTQKASPKKTDGRRESSRKGVRRVPAKRAAGAKGTHARTIVHALFGRVRCDPGREVFCTKTVAFGGGDVSVDLNIEDGAETAPELLDRAAKFVINLSRFDALARAGLRESFERESDSAVALYLSHHLEELSAETLTEIFGKPRESVAIQDFLPRLILTRAGLYPSEGYASFDYTISADESQYVLSVRLDEDGEVLGVEMES
jgi:hypothetical protein